MSQDDGAYTNANRAFLQALLARSTLTYEESKPLLAAILTAHEKRECLPQDITEADFMAYINVANDAISPFDYEIRSAYHQTTRKRIYALVNSTSDPLTQLATNYSADEISFLKRVLDAMFETYNTTRREIMAVTSMQAVQLCKPGNLNRGETQNGSATQGSAGQGLTGKEAERMMKALVEQGWFEKSGKGFYSLSPRAIIELRGWLIDSYNEVDDEPPVLRIKMCYACKDIITTGQRCPTQTCNGRLHDICVQNFFRVQKSTKCPLCGVDWTGENLVGERAAPSNSAAGGKRRSGLDRNTQAEAEVMSSRPGSDSEEE